MSKQIDYGSIYDAVLAENNQLRARVAELEQELAQRWQPLPDGAYDDFVLTEDGRKVAIFLGPELGDEMFQIEPGHALCRLVERAEVQPNGWKSVNESLPEGHAWVLVYADGAIGCMGYSPDKGFEDWTEQQTPNVNISEITHWKELQRPTEVDHE